MAPTLVRRSLPLLFAVATLAPAAPPLVTETVDAPARGSCELETAASRLRAGDGETERVLEGRLACGIGRDAQLSLGLARLRTGAERSSQLELAGKAVLAEAGPGGTAFGLGAGLLAERARGAGWRTDAGTVQGLASRALAPGWMGHANLGWQRSRAARLDSTVWSLGLETTGAPLQWTADLFGDDRTRPWVATGVGYAIGEAAVSLGVAAGLERPRPRQWTLGFRIGL